MLVAASPKLIGEYPCKRMLTKVPEVSPPAHNSFRSSLRVSDLLAFSQQAGEQRSAPAPPATNATSHEEAHQLALSTLAAVVIVLVVVVLVPALAHEMSHESRAEAAAPQHTTGDQETQYPAVITVIVIVLVILVATLLIILVFVLMPIT